MTESGRPLLYSYDDTVYDDAAYLVDRTFDKPYQFTGNLQNRQSPTRGRSRNNKVYGPGGDLLPPNTRALKYFAVNPVMEQESEYNRLNSSQNDSGSQLSFRKSSEGYSN